MHVKRIALALACGSAGCDAPVAGPCRELASDVQPAVVTLEIGGRAMCLAAVVAPGRALTAKHCVQGQRESGPMPPSELTVRTPDGGALEVQAVDAVAGAYEHLGELGGRDLAVLSFSAPFDPEPLALASSVPAVGEEVCVVLATATDAPAQTQLRTIESSQLYTRGLTCPGDSGGPLLDTSGEVIGVASWRTEGDCPRGISAFTRVEHHADWLKSRL